LLTRKALENAGIEFIDGSDQGCGSKPDVSPEVRVIAKNGTNHRTKAAGIRDSKGKTCKPKMETSPIEIEPRPCAGAFSHLRKRPKMRTILFRL
jgi:hypothetical protein